MGWAGGTEGWGRVPRTIGSALPLPLPPSHPPQSPAAPGARGQGRSCPSRQKTGPLFPGRWAGPRPGPKKSFQSEAADWFRETSRCYPSRRAPPLGLNGSPPAPLPPGVRPSVHNPARWGVSGGEVGVGGSAGSPMPPFLPRQVRLEEKPPPSRTSSPAGRGGSGEPWGPGDPRTRRTRRPPDRLRAVTAAVPPSPARRLGTRPRPHRRREPGRGAFHLFR